MFLAAIAVGLFTAYYFGVQKGVTAAIATAALTLVAAVPALHTIAYAVMGLGVAGIALLGPKYRQSNRNDTLAMSKALLKSYANKWFSNKR